jgi:hypothetical protein
MNSARDGFCLLAAIRAATPTIVEFIDYRCWFLSPRHPEWLDWSQAMAISASQKFPILGNNQMLASQFAVATRPSRGSEPTNRPDALIALQSDVTPISLSRPLASAFDLDGDAIFAIEQ